MNPLRGWACMLAASLPLTAHAFTLQWPADCVDGESCFVQNYVDHDSAAAARDFHCGTLTYHGHDGTDIRLPNLAAMRAGVAVLAPADGTVLRVRDGVADASIRGPNDSVADVQRHIAALKDHACGNGVVIQHAEGFETQLCHMRAGSIRVRPGQAVRAGDAVGMIGLSGDTEFPHVHMTVRHNGMVVDPYTAAPMTDACTPTPAASLWATPHPYRATALLGDGFADRIPEKAAMEDTPVRLTTLDAHAPVLTYWIDIMGTQPSDVLSLRITGPDGKVIAEKTQTLAKPSAEYFGFIGKRNHDAWAVGSYSAEVTVTRTNDTNIALYNERSITVP